MERGLRPSIAALIVCLAVLPATAGDDLSELLAGVTYIGVPGVPGPLAVVGEDAFVVVAGGFGKQFGPVVAAARWGKGRVVAFGHGGYLGKGTIAYKDTGRLLRNAAKWVAGERKGRLVAVHCPALGAHLKGGGSSVVGCDLPALPGELATARVLCVDAARLTDARTREVVRRFVRGGGGLITAGLGWGWRQLNPGKDLPTEFPGNLLLADAGIVWGDGTLSGRTGSGYFAGEGPDRNLHAGLALSCLTDGTRVPPEDAARATTSVIRALRSLPPDDRHLLPRLEAMVRGGSFPSGRVARIITAWDLQRIPWANPERVLAHTSAASFPGAVPDDAPRVSRLVEVDHAVPDWQSTGLYAPAGGLLTVTLPAGAEALGLRLRIGCHKDRLWAKRKWRRAPEITHSWKLSGRTTRAASPFGGLVYIEVPRRHSPGVTEVGISGAVEAPWFVLGVTDPEEWKAKIRHHPSPWAELGTGKVVLTVPSEVARKVEDPVALLTFWDRVLDACADLAVRPRKRVRPERYVADIQISAGYMHSGYPIMTHLDAAAAMTHLPSLLCKGPHGYWGLYHEMGHNHQSRAWTFHGAGEVTVNLFSLYILESLCGVTDGHDGVRNGPKAMAEYIAAGADFEVWKQKPFLALYMYAQLKQAFGWGAFKKVFREYRELPAGKRPKTDAEKRDQWMVRFSRTAGKNLGPFFEAWGVPVTPEAKKSIAYLPGWMPTELQGR